MKYKGKSISWLWLHPDFPFAGSNRRQFFSQPLVHRTIVHRDVIVPDDQVRHRIDRRGDSASAVGDDALAIGKFFEAMCETYIPLLDIYERLTAEGTDFRVTMSITPRPI